MDEIRKALISEMDEYAKAAGISQTTVGRLAGQGGRFYWRLQKGKRFWPETAEKVRAWMEKNPPEPRAANNDIARDEHGENIANTDCAAPARGVRA